MDPQKPMLSKYVKLQTISAAMMMLTGCASPPTVWFQDPITLNELDHYWVNCEYKQEQMVFLSQQHDMSHDLMFKVVARRKMDSLKECPR